MIPRKPFIFFLLDTPTGKAYYRDATGTILTAVVTAGSDVTMKEAPGNWIDTLLSFDRNQTYRALNRAYGTPMEIVRDARHMITELFLLGTGTEVPLSIAVFKYNSLRAADGEPDFKLYFKGNLELSKLSSTALESVTVNLIEGGAAQLLKAYENTELLIPCDGSLPEHIKCNYDGQLIQEKLFYEMVPFDVPSPTSSVFYIVPAVYVNNLDQNFNAVHGDPSYFDINANPYFLTSSNYIFYSSVIVTVRIQGKITLAGSPPSLFIGTSTQGDVTDISNVLVPLQSGTGQTTTFYFDKTITLAANEKLFFYARTGVLIKGGDFSLSFTSKPKDSRDWGMTAYDLWKQIGKEVCRIASKNNQLFDYDFTSELLQQYLCFFITSGDALRASNDPTYQRFFFPIGNDKTGYGPMIKITPKQFIQSMNTILMTAAGAEHNGSSETVFLEKLEDVYNSDEITLSLGEVGKLKWRFADELAFSDVSIGYAPQTYDQKAGKYETNTTLKMKAPINSFQKTLEILSFIRWDSYGIERVRAQSERGATTSTTRNDSDNAVFGTVIDRDVSIFDYFRSSFVSLISNPSDTNNTNIHFTPLQDYQKFDMPFTDGEYFNVNKDYGIFVFAVPAASPDACNLTIDGTINSVNKPPLAPADTIIISLVHNGSVIYQSITTVSGINTPISINHNFSQTFQRGDTLYITIATTATGEATINTASLIIGTRVTMSGVNVPVLSGTSQQLLSLPTVSPASDPFNGSSIVQYGFQYFTYNSLSFSNNFNIQLGLLGYKEGQTANFSVSMYINGVEFPAFVFIPGSVPRVQFSVASNIVNRDFLLNDIIFFAASSTGSALQVQFVTSTFTVESTFIKAYNLLRKQYDSLQGLPVFTQDEFGNFRTDMPGSPYNIEYVSPKTCLLRHMPEFKGTFLDQVTGPLSSATLSKNSYLSRTLNGITITENADEDIMAGPRLYYPIEVEVDTEVPRNFADLLSRSANGHIHCTYLGKDIYLFADKLTQKPALNESQVWKGLLSPRSSLSDLANLTSFKIPDMAPNSIYLNTRSTIKFVPYNRTVVEKYHTRNRDEFLFSEQTDLWDQRNNYYQPVQIGDPQTLQFISNELDPVAYTVYTCKGVIYRGPQNLDTIASPAVASPKVLWQYNIDTSNWTAGTYYIVITGALVPILISEPLLVGTAEEMKDTVLIEFDHSENSQGFVFDGVTPFRGSMRFKGGFSHQFKQKYVAKTFIDQPQDIKMINGIPYEVGNLFLGRDWGVPDYEAKKIMGYLLMDGTTLDGEGFSLNDGAQWEEVITKGAPMKLQSIEIRPRDNKTGIVVTSGEIDRDNSLIVSVNPGTFGPNVTNQSGTTDTDLINIVINN